jgi:hypothetical protein
MSTESLTDLHSTWAWVLVAMNAAAGLWALGAHWSEALRGRPLWIFTAVAQVTIVVQAVIGVVLLNRDVPAAEFHEFYGFVAIIAAALIYSYRTYTPAVKQYQYLLYGLGGLFLMGLGLRAIQLA